MSTMEYGIWDMGHGVWGMAYEIELNGLTEDHKHNLDYCRYRRFMINQRPNQTTYYTSALDPMHYLVTSWFEWSLGNAVDDMADSRARNKEIRINIAGLLSAHPVQQKETYSSLAQTFFVCLLNISLDINLYTSCTNHRRSIRFIAKR